MRSFQIHLLLFTLSFSPLTFSQDPIKSNGPLDLFAEYEIVIKEASSFLEWLNSNRDYFLNCQPQKKESSIELCDKTSIPINEIKPLFQKTPKDLVEFIQDKKIKLDILCKNSPQNPFKQWCRENSDVNFFKEVGELHGQFVPAENKIIIQSSAFIGSMVHEYLHSLQFQNKFTVLGHIYKPERVQIQNKINEASAKMIQRVTELEKSNQTALAKTYIRPSFNLTDLMMKFSFWQKLIDERNLFLLYTKFQNELSISNEDVALAAKNMGFLCKDAELSAILNFKECIEFFPLEDQPYLTQVESLIKEIRPNPNLKNLSKFLMESPKISKTLSLQEQNKLISNYLFKKIKLQPDKSYQSRANKDNILPDSVLETKHGHCLGLSTLYLLIAEKNDLPTFLVRAPEHVFVKLCNKSECLNVELLEQAEIKDDNFYIKNKQIPQEAVQKGYYLRGLFNPNELSASLYLGLGFVAGSSKQNEIAELFYKKAIEKSPSFSEAHSNYAAVLYKFGETDKALVELQKAVTFNPYSYSSYINLASILKEKNKLDKSLQMINKAIEINPLNAKAYLVRGDLFFQTTKFSEAIKDYKASLTIEPKNCEILEKQIKTNTTYQMLLSDTSSPEFLSLQKDEKNLNRELKKLKSQKECIYQ